MELEEYNCETLQNMGGYVYIVHSIPDIKGYSWYSTQYQGFVPRRYVRLAWLAVKANMPQLPRVEEFVIYYEETWQLPSTLLECMCLRVAP